MENENGKQIASWCGHWCGGSMAFEKVKEIPLSVKCVLLAAAMLAGGYYVYKHKARFKLG